MGLMAQDKKVKRGKLTFILLEGIGRAFIAKDVEPVRGCANFWPRDSRANLDSRH